MEQLDQDAVRLAKAIREIESGGNFQAKGKSGEYGAYQYTPKTWGEDAKVFGINVPLEQATKEQQNEVAYRKIKSLKDQGYNVGQIASIWNSGKPDAFMDPTYTGTNKYGAKFDVPQYAKSVADTYQKLKMGTEPAHYPTTASTVTPETTQPEEPKKDFLQKAEGIVSKIFPGQKVGQAIGTLAGYIKASPEEKEFYDTSAPTPLQVAGDVAQGALMVGVGTPGAAPVSAFGKAAPIVKTAGTALGRIGQGAALGGAYSATGALAKGETDLGQIAKETAGGAIAGGAVSGAGEALSKITQWLPKRMARGFIGTPANDETIDYVMNKRGLGTPKTMLAEAEKSRDTLGKQLGEVLTNENYAKTKVDGKSLLNAVAQKYPQSGLTNKTVATQLKKAVPLQSKLVDKLVKGKITLDELHKLNSALGKTTFKTVLDTPAMKANKEVSNAFYHTASEFIKKVAPESVPLFDDLAKEYPLITALKKLENRGDKGRLLTLRDLVAFGAGADALGGAGGLTALAAEKAFTSPKTNLLFANLVNKANAPAVEQVNRGLLKPLLYRGVSNVQ